MTKEQIEEIIGQRAKELGISGCISKEPLTWMYPEGSLAAPSEEKEEELMEYEFKEEELMEYEFIVKDVTWQEAYDDCISRGGCLVNIDTWEEYKTIAAQLNSEGLEDIKFWIGGKRDLTGTSHKDYYYWVDKEGNFGERVDKTWESWLSGEPSYWDLETGEEESYMDMYYQKSSGEWVWNDVPEDISMYYSGSIGYICEYGQ